MKSFKLLCFFLLILLINCAQAQQKNKIPQFRNFEWETSPEIIRKNEEAKFLQSFEGFGVFALSFRGNFIGLNARIDFTFKDKKLVEGSYQIQSDLSYEEDFIKIENHLSKLYGKPKYWAIRKFDSDRHWVKETDLGTFRGPELFWEFGNGFIAIHSSRFIDEITIKVLYVYNQKISEYGNADVFTLQY
ncbi:MAG: hypothetical protein A2068_12180 [Ignavibacteria bacterium GWB2_35_6b]|nr:MAG: hypothetical protein A2068_12180 [Ignavibacteria bacterium GWB2_35_6b]